MITPRSLNASERAAFTAARLRALQAAPYFTHALLDVRPLAAPGLGTFAVDRDWRLYLDPDTMEEWGPETSAGVLIHEIGHLVREHARRADAIGSDVDRRVWNFATDAAINDDLIHTGVALPEGVVTPEALCLPGNGIEESYYAALREDPPPGDDQDDELGCGSGAGDPIQEWEADGTPGLSPARQRITRHRVAHEIQEARRRGHAPAGLARWAEDTLTTPPQPWQNILSAAIRHSATLVAGAVTYTYRRPSRRRVPGLILPALRAPRVTVAVVIDTSGSMSQDDLAAALHETKAVVQSVNGTLTVITCDAESNIQRTTDPTQITLIGGGGTDMRVGIEAAHDTHPAPDAVIVLTDGYTPWPDHPTRARLIAALIGQEPPTHNVPDWATTVTIEPGRTPSNVSG